MAEPVAHPPIVSHEEWRVARKALLAQEKALTRQYDAVAAERRRLPMERVEKSYTFAGPQGERTLEELFDGKRQLIVYHFMFDPKWEEGCPGCTGFVDALGDLSMLGERDTAFVLVSRAPLEKLERYRSQRGWDRVWVSSFESDFNVDFDATAREGDPKAEYNFRSAEEWTAMGKPTMVSGEQHGLSVFFRTDEGICRTYSTYGRGCENLTNSYELLDVTPYGRQEDFEDSPAGWPQHPTYGD